MPELPLNNSLILNALRNGDPVPVVDQPGGGVLDLGPGVGRGDCCAGSDSRGPGTVLTGEDREVSS